MPNWNEEFRKKMEDREVQDKWVLTEEQEGGRLQERGHIFVQRHLFASFECSRCPHSWKSAQVVIVFYMQLIRNTWASAPGQVKMKIFRQKCRKCRNIGYAEPSFGDDTVQVVLYNLVQKILEKYYGEVNRVSPLRDPVPEEILEAPHDKENCEACEHGFCLEGGRSTFWDQSWRQEASFVSPACPFQPREKARNQQSCSSVVCFLVAVIILVIIISFLLNSVH